MYFSIYKNDYFIKIFRYLDLSNLNISYDNLISKFNSIYEDFKSEYTNEYSLVISLENKGGNK